MEQWETRCVYGQYCIHSVCAKHILRDADKDANGKCALVISTMRPVQFEKYQALYDENMLAWLAGFAITQF